MALREWILNCRQVATATPAIPATPRIKGGRPVATVATVAVASSGKLEHGQEVVPVLAEVIGWLKPCPICKGHLFTESDRGGYFCCECQTLPEGAKPARIVKSNKDRPAERAMEPSQILSCGEDEKHPGLTWCNIHLEELLAAGWTEAELFKRGWPLGLAWGMLWDDPAVTVTLDQGYVVFIIARNERTVRQVARPEKTIH